jgi:hypothetical protein
MDGWVSSGLTTLKVVGCELTEVPANIRTMFPSTNGNVPGDVVSGELNIPDSVKNLYLSGYTIDGIPMAPVIKFGGSLTKFSGHTVSFEFVKALCARSPLLSDLILRDIPGFDANEMDKWVSSGLTRLRMTGCGLTEVPANIGVMFPLLKELGLGANNIKTLKGVELPPLLNVVFLNHNAGITLEGAVFSSASEIFLSECRGLKGLSVAKFPEGLQFISVVGCDVRWMGSSFRWPESVKNIIDGGNPLMDRRWKEPDISPFSRDTPESLQANMLYNAEDCIGLMVRGNVLPLDLLRAYRNYF